MKRVLVYGMTHNPGGIESYIVNLARRLKNEIAFDYVTDFPEIAYRSFLEEMGSKIYFVPAKGKKVFAHLIAFYKLLKKHPEYDTIYFNILDAGASITEFIPWILGRKVVTHSHNSSTEKMCLHKICRPLLNFFTKEYVACSKIASEYMFGDSKKALIIPNAIDAQKFVFNPELREKKRQELKIGDKFAICHIGRLSLQKNPLRMLDIFRSVLQKEPNAILLSVGTGEMKEEVHNYAKNTGISDNVLFLGERSDISEILQAADVFFLPSLYEGLPIVGIEAQASGLSCVMSDNITQEVDITGNVIFISLTEANEVWAEKIICSANNFLRKNTLPQIIDGGYDINNCCDKDLKLLEMLK